MNFQDKKLKDIVKNKKVLFITTKNPDYIRNTQEVRILSEVADYVDIVSSAKKNYVLRVLAVWFQITKKRVQQCDVVFVGFAPQLIIPFIGYRFKNSQVIIDFFISVYDTLIHDRKKFKDGGVFAKACHYIDKITLNRAEHVITDTKAHANYFVFEFGCNVDLFETIYLEADPQIYYPRKQEKNTEWKDKFVVLYFGSILPLQGVNVVLSAIERFQNRDDVVFEIIGPISQKYHKPIQDNVRYIEWLPQNELAEHIANADVCLAGHFAANIGKANRTIPGKAYIYELMQRPMILGDSEANHELFEADEMHYFTRLGDSDDLYNVIEQVKANVWGN